MIVPQASSPEPPREANRRIPTQQGPDLAGTLASWFADHAAARSDR